MVVKKSVCIYCEGTTKVLETRHSPLAVRRRRKCLSCGKRYTTLELPIVSDYYRTIIHRLLIDIRNTL